jgi:hypothetical protein
MANGWAADMSCKTQLGAERAAQLVKQCIQASPATHPPCNAANSCQLIEDEILRSCELFDKGKPGLCPQESVSATFEGTLVAGSGIDDNRITVRRDDGSRVQAWCREPCENWFGPPDENDLVKLKPSYRGKRVAVTVKVEPNKDRIAGAGQNERLPFVKKASLLK